MRFPFEKHGGGYSRSWPSLAKRPLVDTKTLRVLETNRIDAVIPTFKCWKSGMELSDEGAQNYPQMIFLWLPEG